MATPTGFFKGTRVFAFLNPFFALLLVWMLSQTMLFQRVDRWVCDQQQYRVAENLRFDDAIFLDIDSDSIFNLQSDYGMWPYNRDIYALLLNYLAEKGVKTVVFDVLLLDNRLGDNAFARAVNLHGRSVFVVKAPDSWSDFKADTAHNNELLQGLSWSVSPDLPVHELQNVLLPVPSLIRAQENAYNVGSVDTQPDADGIVRRIPYVYKVGDSYLPTLPLVTQGLHHPDKEIKFDREQRTVLTGGHRWPVDEQGLLTIYYPKNTDFIRNLSLYKVVRNAEGVANFDDQYFFKGKTVFIGSTAFNTDRIPTPRGMMSGTLLLSLIYENLIHDLVLKPQSGLWDSLWIVLALMVLLINVFCRGYCPWKYMCLVGSFMALFVYLNGLLLVNGQQPSGLLFPLLMMVFGYILYVLFFGILIKNQNVLLLEEKSELELVNEALELKANTDPLTGMLNRGAYLSLFEHEIERYKRTGVSFCVGIMDLDFFKKVNDTYGHDIGDDVLRNCAEVLKTTKRELDVVARWGGEEFVIFFPETGLEGTQVALTKIRRAISEMKTRTPQGDLQVTMSIGMAEFDDLAMSPERCIAKADKALYTAKEEGRNRICVRE